VVNRTDWDGLMANCRSDDAEISLVTPTPAPPGHGGSRPLLGVCDGGRKLWLKPPNNPQGPMVPVTEQIVGRAAALIGAPACEVRTVKIPTELAGHSVGGFYTLQPGIAHGSVAVENSVEQKGKMTRRSEDENALRHLGYMALYDWCWGGDWQWLIALSEDGSYYSHDHGWFLPPTGQTWTEAELLARVAEAHEYPDSGDGISAGHVSAVMGRLMELKRENLIDALSAVPASWQVTDQQLETVGYFLEARAPDVAGRLSARFGVLQ